ncbi:DUF2530 domain-containing protein [Lacisediminihabitans changchengi]|uniref:DUF2530 domain-containing protein n=1 Tax=Lacisediminihabitans changchengi TaxID=2787634 RepID=A0A934VYM2_9MICO|nr:DUF2530 domain-containing protein [Lacisediminihabitans changchengi]MBK4348197.1 DUF2530 domain-containing protein [Lacisediminihabitans changchengi]
MKLFLKDSERRADPEPLETDDRKAVLVGLAAWLVAFVVLLVVFGGTMIDSGRGWLLWCCVAGLVIGVIGLVYTQITRRHL